MNKKVMKATFIAAIAMMTGVNVLNAQKSEPLSDIVLANVEALAELEGDKPSVPGTNTTDCAIYCQIDCRYDCILVYSPGNVQNVTCDGYRKKQ